MRKISLFVVFTFIIILSVSSFSLVIQPFGVFGNVSLVRHDLTALIKVVPFAEFELGQNILTLSNINALLNEEEFVIDKTALSNALENGLKFTFPVSLGTYVDLRLGGLRLIPYTRVDGNLFLSLPSTLGELLVGDTLINDEYSDSYSGFMSGGFIANGGLALMLGDFYVAGNAYAPILFIDPMQTTIDVSYTSSASPAYAELNASAIIKGYSRISLVDLMHGRINSLINDLSNVDDYGISLEIGYGNDMLGFAIRNITIRPAKAWYSVEAGGNGNAKYTAEGTNITTDATYSFSEPIFARLSEPIEIVAPIQLTAYLKNDGFIMWGIMGSYWLPYNWQETNNWLNGNWAVKGYAGLNLGIARAYYMLGYNQINYAHTIGIGANLFIFNADLKLTATTNTILPSDNSTPGIGIALTFSGGL